MTKIKSTSLKAVEYDADTKTLTVTFKESGQTYEYHGVPQRLYNALIAAQPTPGRNVFLPKIRNKYPFRKVS